jgi:hypothetical protein
VQLDDDQDGHQGDLPEHCPEHQGGDQVAHQVARSEEILQ